MTASLAVFGAFAWQLHAVLLLTLASCTSNGTEVRVVGCSWTVLAVCRMCLVECEGAAAAAAVCWYDRHSMCELSCVHHIQHGTQSYCSNETEVASWCVYTLQCVYTQFCLECAVCVQKDGPSNTLVTARLA